MKNRTRKNPFQIYLSDDEKYIFEQKFKQSGMKSKTSFIRHLILYGFVYDVDYTPIMECNTQLARIGNNINQIAKKVNTTNKIYYSDIKILKEQMNEIWHIQKSILSNQPYIKQ